MESIIRKNEHDEEMTRQDFNEGSVPVEDGSDNVAIMCQWAAKQSWLDFMG